MVTCSTFYTSALLHPTETPFIDQLLVALLVSASAGVEAALTFGVVGGGWRGGPDVGGFVVRLVLLGSDGYTEGSMNLEGNR